MQAPFTLSQPVVVQLAEIKPKRPVLHALEEAQSWFTAVSPHAEIHSVAFSPVTPDSPVIDLQGLPDGAHVPDVQIQVPDVLQSAVIVPRPKPVLVRQALNALQLLPRSVTPHASSHSPVSKVAPPVVGTLGKPEQKGEGDGDAGAGEQLPDR